MLLSQVQKGAHEKIFISVKVVINEWANDIAQANYVINQRGMPLQLVMKPANSSPESPLGAIVSLGAFVANEFTWVSAIGILESDLWNVGSTSPTSPRSTIGELKNLWVLCQVYGHADRIWTTGTMTSEHRWFAASEAQSGETVGVTSAALTLHPAVSGIVRISIRNATVPYSFTIDFSGVATGVAWGQDGVSTTWDAVPDALPGTFFQKAIARRDTLRVAGQDDVTVDTNEARIGADFQILGLHYAEDDRPASEDNYVHASAAITRGFVMGLGLTPKGI